MDLDNIKTHCHFKKGGIYKITNKINKMFYIGSTNSFIRRLKEHLSDLNKNIHKNKHLQHSFNKYGKQNFIFEILEVVEGKKGKRFIVEQKYIDNIIIENKWEQTYNHKRKAKQEERSCFSKTPEETKKLLSEKSKNMWCNLDFRNKMNKIYNNPEWVKNQSQKQKEVSKNPKYKNSATALREKYSDPQKRKEQSNIIKKIWEEDDGSLKEKLSNSLKKAWEKDDGSRKDKASAAAKIVYFNNKEKITKAKIKAKAKYYGKVISPKGDVFEIYNAQAFIKNHGFSQTFYDLLNGKQHSYKGWKKLYE